MNSQELDVFDQLQKRIRSVLEDKNRTHRTDAPAPLRAAKELASHLPDDGLGLQAATDHIVDDLLPGLNGSSLAPTYYGFVTGGVTPAARLADNLATLFDQNAQVYLPNETAATDIEDRAVALLLELFDLKPQEWPGRCLTTGATAGNILGLASAREYVVDKRLSSLGLERVHGEGLISSCARAGIADFQILTTLPHSSLGKAANIVGLGSASVRDVSDSQRHLHFSMALLEQYLSKPKTASIVVVSAGEVNTGHFATTQEEMYQLRSMCDKYGAWLHVDGAFGLFARVLPPTEDYAAVRAGVAGLELADSIAGDGHKLLNVPYDCGFFFSKHLNVSLRAFQNTGAAYLSSGKSQDTIVSPLNIRLENSARFRGLPVYATLVAYGRTGYQAMVQRMVDMARQISRFIVEDCSHLELLPQHSSAAYQSLTYMCVLFRARDDTLNASLTQRIKDSGVLYGSGTLWDGKPATRFAVAKWNVDIDRDLKVVQSVLRNIM